MSSLCKMSMTIVITINGKPPEVHMNTCVDTCTCTHTQIYKNEKGEPVVILK